MTLHVRVSDDTADALKKLAAADKRTVSGYIAKLLDTHVEQKTEKPGKGKGKP